MAADSRRRNSRHEKAEAKVSPIAKSQRALNFLLKLKGEGAAVPIATLPAAIWAAGLELEAA